MIMFFLVKDRKNDKINIERCDLMFCPNCGKEVDNVKYCPYCGTDISKYTNINDSKIYDDYEPIGSNENSQYQSNYHQYDYPQDDDAPSLGFAFLSFFVPIVGLILYIIWHKEYPQKAKSCLKGIIIGFVLETLLACCVFSAIGDSVSDENYNDYYDTYEHHDDSHHFDFNDDFEV